MKSKILTLGVGAAIAATSFSSCDNSNDFPNLAIASEENLVDDETTAISMKKLSQEEQVYIHDMSLLSHNILMIQMQRKLFECPFGICPVFGNKKLYRY